MTEKRSVFVFYLFLSLLVLKKPSDSNHKWANKAVANPSWCVASFSRDVLQTNVLELALTLPMDLVSLIY